MQITLGPVSRHGGLRGLGVRTLLLTGAADGKTAAQLACCGSLVDVEDAMDMALDRLCHDPMGYDLFVMDCDGYGGMTGGERAVSALVAAGAKMRVMLVSRDFDAPALPFGRRTAVCLPETVDDDQFRRGFDHVLRDRTLVAIM